MFSHIQRKSMMLFLERVQASVLSAILNLQILTQPLPPQLCLEESRAPDSIILEPEQCHKPCPGVPTLQAQFGAKTGNSPQRNRDQGLHVRQAMAADH